MESATSTMMVGATRRKGSARSLPDERIRFFMLTNQRFINDCFICAMDDRVNLFNQGDRIFVQLFLLEIGRFSGAFEMDRTFALIQSCFYRKLKVEVHPRKSLFALD